MKTQRVMLAFAATTAALGCASQMPNEKVSPGVQKLMQDSFRTHGQASVDRLNQDDTQRLCSAYATQPLPKAIAGQIEAQNLATVRYPADSKYIGDWRRGERIAQTGVGLQWSDKQGAPAGGNCYACHQLSREEVSYGNIGPSLYQYGKVRGNSEAIVKYTWAKLYNAEAFTACSNMPRFGHQRILTEDQLRDLMALLLHPESPVNR